MRRSRIGADGIGDFRNLLLHEALTSQGSAQGPAPAAEPDHRMELAARHQRLLDVILNNPGCSLRAAMRNTGLRHATLWQALRELSDGGLVFVAKTQGRIHLLAQEAGIEARWPQALVLQDEVSAWLHAQIRLLAPQSRHDLIQKALRERAWSPSTTHRRLKAMEEAGVIHAVAGRTKNRVSYQLTNLGSTVAVPAREPGEYPSGLEATDSNA